MTHPSAAKALWGAMLSVCAAPNAVIAGAAPAAGRAVLISLRAGRVAEALPTHCGNIMSVNGTHVSGSPQVRAIAVHQLQVALPVQRGDQRMFAAVPLG